MLLKSASAAVALSLGLIVSAVAAPAVDRAGSSHVTVGAVTMASFQARPYPYRYRWRVTPCVRRAGKCTNRVRALGSLIDPTTLWPSSSRNS